MHEPIPIGEPAVRTRPVLAAQQPTAQRRPQRRSKAERLGHRQVLPVGTAFDEAVLQLHAGNRYRPAHFGHCRCACRHPRGKVRQPGVQDLACPCEIIESAHDLVEWGHEIGKVHPQQIDVVGAEPTQAALDGPQHRTAAVAGLQHPGAVGTSDGELRRHSEVVAPAVEQAAENLLCLSYLIARGGVDERAARVGERVEDPRDVLGGGAVTPPRTERACTEGEGGDS